MLAQIAAAEPPSATVTAAIIALGATVIGAGIAVAWPSLQSRLIARRFVDLIRRELEEIGPKIEIKPELKTKILGDSAYRCGRSTHQSAASLCPECLSQELVAQLQQALPIDKPWWTCLSKRFVHQEFLSRERISDHRDFVLSLDPTLVYLLSQLWTSFDNHDGDQWKYFLCELAKLGKDEKVWSADLERAATLWKYVVSALRA